MESFSYLDIVVVAVVGFLVLFVLLIGWQLFRQLIQLRSNQHKVNHQTETSVQTNKDVPTLDDKDEDEETKIIAVLMALILANEDRQDRSYQVTKIERIR
ncbi:MAG: oxaloacetate decarboxylase [Carnobacterium sp.]|uniref:oxaloacetate decarboxylase n=1 Tax=Carnobacterium sp. TaxID=48221 RepID=UPI003315E5E8